jgi:hypothetical protein
MIESLDAPGFRGVAGLARPVAELASVRLIGEVARRAGFAGRPGMIEAAHLE